MKKVYLIFFCLISFTIYCSQQSGPETNSGGIGPASPPEGKLSDWKVWTKNENPNWLGQTFEPGESFGADPSVFKENGIYHLFHTCYSAEPLSPINISSSVCHATSSDGVNWSFVTNGDGFFPGVVFRGRAGEWDEEIETAHVIKENGIYHMYYMGYRRLSNGTRPPSGIGHATSSDGILFTRSSLAPVMNATPSGPDSDDLVSPITFLVDGVLKMIYVGYCVDGFHDGLPCPSPAIQIVGATRSLPPAGGQNWIKHPEVVLGPRPDIAWMKHGVAEPEILKGPDDYYYLFATGGLADDEPRVTGIARSKNPFGPWDINPEPIVKPSGKVGAFDACGTFAPAVVLDQSLVKMWYLGLDDCRGQCTSCNFASCGCEGRWAIGYAEATWPLR